MRMFIAAMAVLALVALTGAGSASATPAKPVNAQAKGAPVAGHGGTSGRHVGHGGSGNLNLGPNVIVFDPSMPQSQIQSQLDQIATQQVPNQFGSQRYAVLFKPGTYGSAAQPLDFQVGYYTEIAGLGATPGDVVVNGAINVFNQCSAGSCEGLDNFWRSLSNLTLTVHLPSSPPAYTPNNGEDAGCKNSNEMWAVSQAAPMRRVVMNGNVTLQDYCGQGFVSGGFLANDEFNPPQGQSSGVVINAGQQQFFTRNSNIDSWTNGVWNQVFLADNGAPATSFGPGTNQHSNVPSARVSEEPPFLYTDGNGELRVFVPAVRRNSVGPSYGGGSEAGRSLPPGRFFVAGPSTPVDQINAALRRGRSLILEPGVYQLDRPIMVTHPHTVVLGLGFPTLIPQRGNVAMRTGNVPGIKLNGIIFDAGAQSSPALLQAGSCRPGSGTHSRSHARVAAGCRPGETQDTNDPTLLSDVFFRVGGAEPGRTTAALVVDANNAILDDIWAWRADHGAGVGWTNNTADNGVVVNGDNVSAYGLFVEHFQKDEVVWNGQHGLDVFFQNEMPYDPPNQAAWMSSPATDGYPAFRVGSGVTSFQGYGMGSYSFFNQGVPIFADMAFASPTRPGIQFTDLLTVFLDATHGSGGIRSVINGVGGASTAANADKPVDVIHYP
jgi:hypothetical protein